MNTAERSKYFGTLWPAACRAKGWSTKDDGQRRLVVAQCMIEVRGPQVASTSDPAFGADEVTALFCYLDHLGAPDSLDKSARWADCKTDYRAYNRARQADWHEGETYGHGKKNKLQRNRFGGAKSAAGGPLDTFDPEAIRKRHLTMANRHRKKAGQGNAGQIPASQPLARVTTPAPALQPAFDEGEPF